MSVRSVLSLLLLLAGNVLAQSPVKVYSWEVAMHASPDTVYGISFEKMKLTELPEELAKYTQLHVLELGKNRLTEIPAFVGKFNQLERINLEKNELTKFPEVLCGLPELREIILNRNTINILPPCIQKLQKLEYIDAYDNPISSLPEELVMLPNLREIDLRGVSTSREFQKKWVTLLPKVTFHFETPCDCMH